MAFMKGAVEPTQLTTRSTYWRILGHGGMGKVGNRRKYEVDLGLPEAPTLSIEEPPKYYAFPAQGQDMFGIKDDNGKLANYCHICRDDAGGAMMVCCDCTKVFHLRCHIPDLLALTLGGGQDRWRCNFHTSRYDVECLMRSYPEEKGSENRELTEGNRRQFTLACKFLMEFYRIPEMPTMRWEFPAGYLVKYGRVPYHPKYIKEKLCTGVPEPFGSVQDMFLAFKQMFEQAFVLYQNDKIYAYAQSCFEKFLALVEEYYPEHRDLFASLEGED